MQLKNYSGLMGARRKRPTQKRPSMDTQKRPSIKAKQKIIKTIIEKPKAKSHSARREFSEKNSRIAIQLSPTEILNLDRCIAHYVGTSTDERRVSMIKLGLRLIDFCMRGERRGQELALIKGTAIYERLGQIKKMSTV